MATKTEKSGNIEFSACMGGVNFGVKAEYPYLDITPLVRGESLYLQQCFTSQENLDIKMATKII